MPHTTLPTPTDLLADDRWWITASDGRRFPLIAGAEGEGGDGGGSGAGDGSGSGDDSGGSGDGGDDDKGGKDDDQLGDAGKRALDAERKARKEAEKRAKAAEAERDRLKQQTETESEKRVREAAEQARAETLGKAKTIALKGAIKAAAAGKLANPDLAVRLVDLEDFEVNDDGELTDPEKLSDAIDQLVKDNPGLAPAPKGGGRPSGNADGGARGNGSRDNVGFGPSRLKAAFREAAKT